jgi:hypothetical protein
LTLRSHKRKRQTQNKSRVTVIVRVNEADNLLKHNYKFADNFKIVHFILNIQMKIRVSKENYTLLLLALYAL